MALSKVQLCLNEMRHLCCHTPLSSLLLKRRLNPINYGGLSFSLFHRQLKVVDKRLLATSGLQQQQQQQEEQQKKKDHGKGSSLQLPKIVTKDRLILLGLGIVVVGCLVGWEKISLSNRRHKDLIKVLHRSVLTAQNAVKDGHYEEAVEHYRNARTYVDHVHMSTPSVHNKVILNIVDQLGHLAFELNNWEEADKYLKETEEVMLKCGIEKDDDSYVEVILRIAYIDTLYGRKNEAMDRFNFCITTLENKISVQDIYSEEYSDRLTLYGMALTEFGTYTKQLGLLDASEHAFSKALNVCRNVLGPNHEQTSVLANDLATVYDEKGKFNKAIRLAEKAIKIATETAPGNLATYKYNLAHILMHKGDMARARNALREALHLAEVNEDDETKELAESSIMKLDIAG